MQSPEQQVLEADATRRAALLAADRDALEHLLADEFRYVHASGKRESKEEYLNSVTPGAPKFLSFSVQDTLLHVYGDVVVYGGAITLMRKAQGAVLAKEHQFTGIWVNRSGAWKLVSFQNSSTSKA